ncbi:MAG TPA: hypothetical protein IAB65_03635 [Candidatus Onthocola stercorigallinarum]|nr:hypothetical protein [Candidatus Onthocola stercorigallinarum]
MDKINRILWGLVFIVLGVIIALNVFNIIDFNIFFRGWWLVFIIVPCFIGLFDNTNESKVGNIVGLVIGVLLLLMCNNLIRFDIIIKLFIPAIFVIIGLYLILGSSINSKVKEKINSTNKDNLESIVATFSEKSEKPNKFNGAKVDAIFGSVYLDLSESSIKNESVIVATGIFGSVNIKVPEDVQVIIKSTPIFGGVSNKSKGKNEKKIIYIEAYAVFGSVDIK